VNQAKKLKNAVNSKVFKVKMIDLKKNKIDMSTLPQDLPAEYTLANVMEMPIEKLQELSVPQLKKYTALVDQKVVEFENEKNRLLEHRNNLIKSIGNVVHDSVPINDDEEHNEIYKTYGDFGMSKQYSHRDLIIMVDGVDLERGTRTAGSRAYYLRGPLLFLEQALINYGLQMLDEKNYTPLSPPVFMNKNVMGEVAQLSQFDEELYGVLDGKEKTHYLIATSEQPLAAYHKGEYISKEDLAEPIRYAGISNCFRKEAGTHGRDTAGIFRVHQFQKLEQFVLTSPNDNASWTEMENMLACCEKFYQALDIPYRVVNMVSGELNSAASKKYDLEAWFCGSKAFRELVSCSNCTDYQSRRLDIRYGMLGDKKDNPNKKGKGIDKNAAAAAAGPKKAEFVHMLNSTLCATTRTICAILETHQTENGVIVPEVLRSYMPQRYRETIPYVKPAPIDLEQDIRK